MKNNAIRTIRSEEITIDVRICAALAANRGSGEVYLAAIAPDSPTLIVATLTSKTEKKAAQPTHCLVESEKLEPSIVQAEQIFTIDKSRVQNFVGHLTPEEMSRVDDAVKISLALNPMGSIQKLKPIIRSTAAYAPPETVDGKPPGLSLHPHQIRF